MRQVEGKSIQAPKRVHLGGVLGGSSTVFGSVARLEISKSTLGSWGGLLRLFLWP